MEHRKRGAILRALGLGKGRAGGSAEARLREAIPFDPEKQAAVIRSSVCTGEKVAGFKDLEGGHFTEVMLIRSKEDERRFMEIYRLEKVKTEY